MQLVVITPDKDVAGERELVKGLFEAGLQRLHLRKPAHSVDEYRGYVKNIDSGYHGRIVLHNHFELLKEFDLAGAHLGSYARVDERVWRQIDDLACAKVSASFHSWQEIKENEFPFGYVFISPVFDSISKKGYKAGIDLAGARELKQYFAGQNKYCPKIYGLGGVGEAQISVLQQYGFDGAALLGSIWQATDPVKEFKQIAAITNSLKGH